MVVREQVRSLSPFTCFALCRIPEDDVCRHFGAQEGNQHVRICKMLGFQSADRLADYDLPRLPTLQYRTNELSDFLDLLVAQPVI